MIFVYSVERDGPHSRSLPCRKEKGDDDFQPHVKETTHRDRHVLPAAGKTAAWCLIVAQA